MTFPLDATGVDADLVKLLSVNCKSADAAVEQSCRSMLHTRAAACVPVLPRVFDTKADYQAWARPFARCVAPLPICHGVEVTSFEQCSDSAQG
jgi:hypothetical protein